MRSVIGVNNMENQLLILKNKLDFIKPNGRIAHELAQLKDIVYGTIQLYNAKKYDDNKVKDICKRVYQRLSKLTESRSHKSVS